MIKKRKQLILLGVTLFVVLLTIYLLIIIPLVNQTNEKAEEPLVLVDDIEQEGIDHRYLMFEQLSRNDINSIVVNNQYGSYEVYKSGTTFVIRNYEDVVIDPIMLSYLVNSTGYTLTNSKICDYATKEQFEQYGLNEPQASWTITSTAGKSYIVEVGSPLITDSGYYVRLVGRDSIYILDTLLDYTILQPVETIVSKTILSTIAQTNYYLIDQYKLYKGETLFLHAKNVVNSSGAGVLRESELIYPSGYSLADAFDNNLYSLSQLTAISIEKLGVDDSILENYGLLNPAYTINFKYDNVSYKLKFSERQNDGNYYMISSTVPQVISLVDGEKFAYLEDSFITWIAPHFFWEYISDVKSIHISGKATDVTFEITNTYDAQSEIFITEVVSSTGKYFDENDSINFKKFYQYLVSLEFVGETSLSSDEIAELITKNPYLIFEYTKTDDTIVFLKFYQYSSGKSLLSVNGDCQFYVYTDVLDVLINNINRVLNDEDVDPSGKK